MKISRWRKSTEILQRQEAWLSTINVEATQDGQPITCIVSAARYNDDGDIVTMLVEFNAHEMMQIAMGEWHIKNHEYTNKIMAENRRQADL